MQELLNKTVLITGGSAGVGLASARRFLDAGANVVITGRNAERLAAAEQELGGAEKLHACAWDSIDTARAVAVFTDVEQRFGALHVLVNNAGCNHRGDFSSIGADAAAAIIDTNLRAPILLTHAALPFIRRAGGGAIVNVASLAGRVPLAHEACYSASKFGLRGFTLSLAEELAGSGISASVVSPGPIDTGFILSGLDEVPDLVFSQPMSSADDIAALIVACVQDGRPERAWPVVSGWLANAAYLFPALSRALRPMLIRRGQRAKAHFRARRGLAGR